MKGEAFSGPKIGLSSDSWVNSMAADARVLMSPRQAICSHGIDYIR